MKTLLLILALAFGTRVAYADFPICAAVSDGNAVVEDSDSYGDVVCVDSYDPAITSEEAAESWQMYGQWSGNIVGTGTTLQGVFL